MILADTSAWVEYDQATGSATDQRISELIATGEPMIAAVAWRERAAILARDVDLDRVAGVVGIDLDEPSQTG